MILNGHTIVNPGSAFLGAFKLTTKCSDENVEDIFASSPLTHTWTFDDAHSDLYIISNKYFLPAGLRFRFFVCPMLIDAWEDGEVDYVRKMLRDPSANLLTWKEIENLVSLGHLIGSHGLDHKPFDTMSNECLHEQLSKSQEAIFSRVGIMPTTFALPFGRLGGNGDEVKKIASKYYLRTYLSDNKLPLFSTNGLINRRHSEFGKGYVRSLSIGIANLIGIR